MSPGRVLIMAAAIHVGHAGEIVLDSAGKVVHGDPTSRSNIGVGPRPFGIFAPWENVKDALNIATP